jgi:hypothetical protein
VVEAEEEDHVEGGWGEAAAAEGKALFALGNVRGDERRKWRWRGKKE